MMARCCSNGKAGKDEDEVLDIAYCSIGGVVNWSLRRFTSGLIGGRRQSRVIFLASI